MHEHFEILGEWHPDTTNWPLEGNGTGHHTIHHGSEYDWPYGVPFMDTRKWEIRTPQAGHEWQRRLSAQGDPGSGGFHRDGGLSAIIVWSNIYPTEMRLPDGTITVPKPGSVVLINNMGVLHRTPPSYLAQMSREIPKRWFMRHQLMSAIDDTTIEAWKGALA